MFEAVPFAHLNDPFEMVPQFIVYYLWTIASAFSSKSLVNTRSAKTCCWQSFNFIVLPVAELLPNGYWPSEHSSIGCCRHSLSDLDALFYGCSIRGYASVEPWGKLVSLTNLCCLAAKFLFELWGGHGEYSPHYLTRPLFLSHVREDHYRNQATSSVNAWGPNIFEFHVHFRECFQ